MSSAAVETTVNGDIMKGNYSDTDSVDKELDWLIDKEEPPATKKSDLDTNVTEDGDYIPRTASPMKEEEPSRSSSRLGSDSDDDSDYELTEEQREAEQLMQKMREEGSLPSEDPPEYDVTERIKQLNEELAQEGEVEEKKERKVGFKDNLIELEVSPLDDENDKENEEQIGNLSLEDRDQKKQSNGEVVVERNGKFEVVPVSELSPEERAAHGIETNGHQPAPPSRPRPATATGSTGSRRKIVNSTGQSQRAQSAGSQGRSQNVNESNNITYEGYSAYGLTPEQVEYKKEHARLMNQRRKEQQEKEKDEKKRRQDEAESAFQAWLQKKKEEEENRKKEEKESREREEQNARDAAGAYKQWLKAKKSQKKKEKKEDKHKNSEESESYYLRSREDCDKAYKDHEDQKSDSHSSWTAEDHKEWLKRKNGQLKAQKALSRSHNLRRRLEARKSRKSQNLAKAIRQAQTYKYTDYYGYRY
ncbi:uncharacterized protein LOC100378461 isoform X2 [Saccoglossus kowalevskii]|uniref:Coiled-coil domain-containing protein 181 n=1 Tax=Saccoglossus kowalevskii TaxID=10224 RepID=A0ABM0M4C6_SACKO|nr:PREDICTED: coiled-coil domain-containing protein 181-like isoform X3 [Saccoglossus kowalevskii]